jgi:hypothetical protein
MRVTLQLRAFGGKKNFAHMSAASTLSATGYRGSGAEALATVAGGADRVSQQFMSRFVVTDTAETIRQALTKNHDGGPATLLGAALDKLTEARQ